MKSSLAIAALALSVNAVSLSKAPTTQVCTTSYKKTEGYGGADGTLYVCRRDQKDEDGGPIPKMIMKCNEQKNCKGFNLQPSGNGCRSSSGALGPKRNGWVFYKKVEICTGGESAGNGTEPTTGVEPTEPVTGGESASTGTEPTTGGLPAEPVTGGETNEPDTSNVGITPTGQADKFIQALDGGPQAFEKYRALNDVNGKAAHTLRQKRQQAVLDYFDQQKITLEADLARETANDQAAKDLKAFNKAKSTFGQMEVARQAQQAKMNESQTALNKATAQQKLIEKKDADAVREAKATQRENEIAQAAIVGDARKLNNTNKTNLANAEADSVAAKGKMDTAKATSNSSADASSKALANYNKHHKAEGDFFNRAIDAHKAFVNGYDSNMRSQNY